MPLAQADRLDAPSGSWVAGDWLVQLHQFMGPSWKRPLGEYPAYHWLVPLAWTLPAQQTERLTVQQNGTTVGDNLQLTELVITE